MISDEMLVSIITVSYNSEKTISRAIESVLNQSYKNIEYIIVDGASSDNTVKVAESYEEVFKQRPGRSLRIVSEPDRGMYDALNKGAKMASGTLVGQINTDDWYEPDAVEKMVRLYEQEQYDVAWGSINIIKPSGNIIKHAKTGRFWTSAGFCCPAMFSRREVILEFPYALDNMYDDFEYVTRIHRSGRKICTSDEIISNFTFGGMSTEKNLASVRKRIGYKWHIYRKYHMSFLYWFYCVAMEMAKYVLG